MAAAHVVRLSEPPREAPATGPLAAPGISRLVGFGPLALFGALQWGGLLNPDAEGRLVLGVIAAVAAGALLLAAGAAPQRWARVAAVVLTTFALALVALLLAGVPPSLLRPRSWDELAAGLAQGVSSLPAITVPYRGADEWVRSALIATGVLLTGLSALIAFWPRPGGRAPGFSLGAAVALGALFTIPIVQHGPQSPFLSGACFCVLLATFLWLERLRADQVGVGGACVLAATALGVAVAPRFDQAFPWIDYEHIAEGLQPEKAATFSWDHSYGPMTWPRDGREVLRIRARAPAYWKTVNLDAFDGTRWVSAGGVRRIVDTETQSRRDWFQTIRVVVRGLSTRQFIGAGHTIQILPDGPPAVSLEPGTFQTIRGPLEPGSSYQARVYVPRPTDRQLRTAGIDYPEFATDYLDMRLPRPRPDARPRAVRFATFGSGGGIDALFPNGFHPGAGEPLVRASPYAGMYQLAQTLKDESATPLQYVQAVLQRVQDGATYSESPPPSRVPLVDFLFRSHLGYCQQFSGAMALLLRMGGVPARVASGFSPGRFDRKRGEYVVRDDDAHSWVEAYFPGIGWQTLDPTPAASPARSQISDSRSSVAPAGAPEFPRAGSVGDRALPGESRTAVVRDRGVDWQLLAGLGAVALLLAAGAVALARRGRVPGGPAAPELAELQRALHRTGRTPEPGTTLRTLERLLGSSGGGAYVRAVREQRYGGAGRGPTAEQRRALRRELARGAGLRGRIRAWWALPPRLGTRRGESYTG
ncbi:MAG: protein-glutamine gamma-glutamyltransferase [Solirubrobacteraceae bacterium]|nr:protein-glutamine gamma-glutamyltransferase [Solirubrobacteraceae bacterium]